MVDMLNNGNQPTVPALTVITPQMPNTLAQYPVYFHCTAPNASFCRQDGKKLPFVHGICKAVFKEDIEYLQHEVLTGNPYIRAANAQEVQAAETMEDPLGAVTKMLRPHLRDELKHDLSLEELEDLIAKKKLGEGRMVATGAVIPMEGANANTPAVEEASKYNLPTAAGGKLDPAIVARAQAAINVAKRQKELLEQRQGGAAGSLSTATINDASGASNSN